MNSKQAAALIEAHDMTDAIRVAVESAPPLTPSQRALIGALVGTIVARKRSEGHSVAA